MVTRHLFGSLHELAMNVCEPYKDKDKVRKIHAQKTDLDDAVPELLQLKKIQEYWDSFEDDELLAS